MLFQLRLQGSTLQLYKNITPQGGIFDAFLNDKLYIFQKEPPFEIIFKELIYPFWNINKSQIQNFGSNICFTEKFYRSGIMGVNNSVLFKFCLLFL